MMKRFWDKVDKSGECWLWTGAIQSNGYGQFKRALGVNETVTVHRMSYEMEHGPIAKGMVVRHSCDTPACVNPAHLSLGTQADNLKDMDHRGRRVNGGAKLTVEEVQRIRQRLADGDLQKEIAADFGVAQSQISNIKTGAAWS